MGLSKKTSNHQIIAHCSHIRDFIPGFPATVAVSTGTYEDDVNNTAIFNGQRELQRNSYSISFTLDTVFKKHGLAQKRR